MDYLIPGEIVQLKSGGPRMTVEAVNDDGVATCSWFDESNVLHRANFLSGELRRVS